MTHDSHPMPSTFDAPPMRGGQDDPVLTTLQNALERYRRGGTMTNYVGVGGSNRVCAVGALIAEDGLDEARQRSGSGDNEWVEDLAWVLDSPGKVMRVFERFAADVTKEAMATLTAAAEELYGEEARQAYIARHGIGARWDDEPGKPFGWPFGLVEYINQTFVPLRARPGAHTDYFMRYRKPRVIKCYERAIEMRQALVAA